MLWYKAWLETRWRFVFLLGTVMLVWLTPLWLPAIGMGPPPAVVASRMWSAVHLGTVFTYIFTAIYLAGSGVNTQTTYSATSGFHGSMLFTLSLPVSRRQLLFTRVVLGALQTSVIVAIMAGFTLLQRPGATSVFQSFSYMTRAIVCTMVIYTLSTLLACFLDEMWQFSGAFLCCIALFLLQSRFDVVSRISPFRGMSLISYPITTPMPWAPVLSSLVLASMLLSMSMLILQRKEY